MKNYNRQPHKKRKSRDGMFIPALCSILGVLIILTVIALCGLLLKPDLFGDDALSNPLINRIVMLLGGVIGKVYLLLFTLCGVLFIILAANLRENQRIREKMRYAKARAEWESDAQIPGGEPAARNSTGQHDCPEKAGRKMRKRRGFLRFAAMCLTLSVFIVSVGAISYIRRQYREAERKYDQAAANYTSVSQPVSSELFLPSPESEEQIIRLPELAPITVDFEALQSVNPDVVGWIYCPDTVINYPVLQGEDNNTYLHTNYDGTYNSAGSIFVEEKNRKEFQDFNSILYGHHMADGSMFATLEDWQKQEYFDEHPAMWLLTPDQDYRITLYSAYTLSAYDDAYSVYPEDGEDARDWVNLAKGRSAVVPSAVPMLNDKHVMLSTCAYVFDNARSVVHGLLLPISSAGGSPLT